MGVMEDLHEETDEAIAKVVQNGDAEAFGVLIERYEGKIFRYGKRFLFQYEDIEDAVQDSFVKAYTNIQSFDTDQRFSPWIYRIAHNTFINIIKKKGKEALPFFDMDTLLGNLSSDENPEQELIEGEDRELLNAVVNMLPVKYREPIILYFFEERDYKDIADIMRIPTSTVGVRMRRGKKLLKKLYDEHEQKNE